MSEDQSIPPPPSEPSPTVHIIPASFVLPSIDTTPIPPSTSLVSIKPSKRVKRSEEEVKAAKREYDAKYYQEHVITNEKYTAIINENAALRAQVNELKSALRHERDLNIGYQLQLKSVNAYSLMLTESKLREDQQKKINAELMAKIAQQNGL